MQTIIDTIFLRRYFWKSLKLSGLNELYASLTLRALSLGLIGIFIPVYLFKTGYSIQTIALFYGTMYGIRIFIDPLIGYLIARFGPKRIIQLSFVFEVLFILSLIMIGSGQINLWVALPSFVLCIGMFYIPFTADFSKQEDEKIVGVELSYQIILEKITGVLGPLAGGLIATIYGFETTIIISLAITLLAVLPLYIGADQSDYKEFRYHFKFSDYLVVANDRCSLIGRGLNMATGQLFWPLLAVIVIFAGYTYSGLGLITAVGTATTMLTAHLIGKLVDRGRGRILLRIGVWATSITHIFKPFINTIQGAIGINIVGESSASMQELPYMKGYYHNADNFESGRVAYTIASLSYMHLSRTFIFLCLALILCFISEVDALRIIIFIGALGALLILTEKFSALDPKKIVNKL